MQHYAPRLVRGAALEAIGAYPASNALVAPPDATRHLLAALADQRPVTVSAAAGDAPHAREQHYCFDGIVASVLCYQDRPVHLCVSPLEELESAPEPPQAPFGNAHGRCVTHCQTVGDPGALEANQALFRIQALGEPPCFLRLSPGNYNVGRSSRSDLQLDFETVSRTHLRLQVGPGRVGLVDLNSTNGVTVNDEPVLLTSLEPFDRVSLGSAVELQLLRRPERY